MWQIAVLIRTTGDGGSPCQNCHRHARACVYPNSFRGKRPKTSRWCDSVQIQKRLADIQVIPYEPPATGYTITTSSASQRLESHALSTSSLSERSHPAQQNGPSRFSNDPTLVTFVEQDSPSAFQMQERLLSTTDQTTQSALQSSPQSVIDQPDFEEDVLNTETEYWEHHGPWSFVSVCSQPGIQFVCDRTQSSDFVEIANRLTKAWSRRLRLNQAQARPRRSPELDEATAWRYVRGGRTLPMTD